jgi:IPT/TIG domain-containing protein
MTILAANGTTKLSKTGLLAKTTDVPSDYVTVNEDIYEIYNYAPYEDRFATFEGERKLLFKSGQVVRKTDIDLLYPTATITAISPATGPAAGGTAVVITGVNFSGATGVTFGGTAGTSFSVVNDTTINVTTPAKTAGTYDVVIADDAGNVTKTGGFVYT